MILNTINIIDDFLDNPVDYARSIRNGEFKDLADGEKVFKNLQFNEADEVVEKLLLFFPDHEISFNFSRKSPKGQKEPNLIHSDAINGDLICLLYLNENFPEEAGTSIYEYDGSIEAQDDDITKEGLFTKSIDVRMKFNRMVIFPANLYHARNIEENFGEGNDSRLVRVTFLKKTI